MVSDGEGFLFDVKKYGRLFILRVCYKKSPLAVATVFKAFFYGKDSVTVLGFMTELGFMNSGSQELKPTILSS